MKTKISRREFIKNSIKSTTLMGLASSFPQFQKNSRTKEYDLLISGGLVYDGLGNPGREIDIAIKKNKFCILSSKINTDRVRRIIRAKGLSIAPGFIDAHSHTDIELLVNPKAESQVRQGVTTEISGNCGSSPFPLADSIFEEKKKIYKEKYDIDLDWRDIHGFFSRLTSRGMSLNYATLVGHGNVRGHVVGYNDKQPTESQLNQMKKIVDKNLKAGALGISTGLIYPPGSYAKISEIIELCRIVSQLKGVYATHMRNENDYILEAIEEALTIARKTGVSLQISHLKVSYPRNWSKINKVLQMLDRACKEGINILADRYPYIAGANDLSDSLFPLWSLQGTTEDFIKRLKDPALETRLRAHQKKELQKIGSWEKILISDVFTKKNKIFEGKNILEASREARKEPYEFIKDLLIEEKNRVGKISFYGSEDNLKKILSHPKVVVGADGSAIAPYGTLGKGKPHPRLYSTFARILGKYAREEKIFTFSKAIQKMTSLTAKKFGLGKRGQIQEGFYADAVIFDSTKVKDLSTWENPHQYPSGIEYVIVNGQVVIDRGDHTGNLPGVLLKRG